MGLLASLCTVAFLGCGGGERQDADEPEGEFPVEIVSAEFPAKQRLAQTSELTLSVANVGDETIPDLAITAFTVKDPDAQVAVEEDVSVEEDTTSTETEDSATTTTDTASDSEGNPIPEDQLGDAVDQALQEELEQQETDTEDSDTTETDGTSTEQTLPEAEGAFSIRAEQADLAIPSRPVWILEQGYPRIAGTEAGEPPPGEIAGAGGAEAAQTNTFSFGSLEPNETREVVFLVTPVQSGVYTVHYRIAAGLQGKAVAVNEDSSIPEGEFVVQITDVPPQTRVDDAGNVVPIKKGDIIGQAGTNQQKEELGQ